MFPIPHFTPLYVDALGTAVAGIAAAIAGAIAVKIFGSKQRQAAPVAQAGAGSARSGESARDDERTPMDRPAAPPARIRLALPPESSGELHAETEPRIQALDQARQVPEDLEVPGETPEAPGNAAAG